MKNILILSLSILTFASYAQEQPQVIIVREGKTAKSKQKKEVEERNVENYDAFKFDPLRMVIGEINFSWEHRIAEKASFEVELGPTISELDYFNNVSFIHSGETKVGSMMGFLASGGIRYYPTQDLFAMNKLYISPRIKYRQYNSSYNNDLLASESIGFKKEVLFSFIIGTQRWYTNNFAFDYYAGLTLGSYNQREYYMEELYDGTTGTFSQNWREQNYRGARFTLSVGMKVTIGN